MKTIIPVSGLPRSGSTLLMNVLAQHPLVHSTATSGLHEIMYLSKAYFKTDEFRSLTNPNDGENLWYDFMRAGLINANNKITDRSIIADKCRAWIGSAGLFFKLFPNGKMIVPIRDIRGVISSMEKKYQKHPEFQLEMNQQDTSAIQTVEGRVQFWLQHPPIGIAIQRLHELVRLHKDKVHFVHMEDLIQDPTLTMQNIWKYLEIDGPTHDFNNIEQYTHEHELGWPYGDHTIRSDIKPVKPDWNNVLGRNISEVLREKFDWINNL